MQNQSKRSLLPSLFNPYRRKQAQEGLASPIYGARHTPASQLAGKEQATRQLLSLLGIGAASGVGARGLMGLRDLINPAKVQATPSAGLPQPINLMRAPREDEQQKFANGPQPAAQPGLVDRFVKMVAPYMPNTHTTHPLMNTPYMPMGMLALGGGAYGGYKGLDWLLKKEKDQRSRQAVQDAKKEYEQSLSPQYKAAMAYLPIPPPDTLPPKPSLAGLAGSTAGTLGRGALLGGGAYGGYRLAKWLMGEKAKKQKETEAQQALSPQYKAAMADPEDSLGIDELATAYIEGGRNKEAVYALADAMGFGRAMDNVYPRVLNPLTSTFGHTGHDAWEGFKGTADSAALALAIGAGLGSYNWAKGQNKDEVLRKALKKRQMQRAKASPVPLIARTETDA